MRTMTGVDGSAYLDALLGVRPSCGRAMERGLAGIAAKTMMKFSLLGAVERNERDNSYRQRKKGADAPADAVEYSGSGR